jgi:surface carbohydrate biosynthesis protein
MNIISKYINFILLSKKKLFFPEEKRILIFDVTGSQNFSKYLKKYDYSILNTRFEELNIPILLKTLCGLDLSYQSYLFNYINTVKPKIILTFIDNNPLFYKLKKNDKNLKTIFVQNGIRSSFNDIFAIKHKLKKKDNNVDFMFVANKVYGKKYSSFVTGKTIPIGYFRNNSFKISKKKRKKEILLISVFRNYSFDQKIYKNITFGDFFSNDKFFFNWLDNFCSENKLKINILARSSKNKDFIVEKNYFEQFFSNPNIIFEKDNPYKHIDRYEYVVTNDSTLGIENLARGGKTAFISNSPNIYPLITRKFGHNENLKKNGPFWTSENNTQNFKRVLKYLINSKRKDWNKYTKHSIVIDKNNKIFQETIKTILNDR